MATKNILEAQAALKLIEVPEKVNRTPLEKAIEKAEKINLAEYKDGAEKDIFVLALKNAKEAYKNAATQLAIDNALSALNTAQNNLVKIEKQKPGTIKVDKSKLEKFYKEALTYYKEANHSKKNWEKYEEALNLAAKVLKDDNATQKDVDKALKEQQNITKKLNKELRNPSNAPQLPNTGDESGANILILALVITTIGFVVLTYNRKKKNIFKSM